jgi:hypothetical protein
MSEKPKTDSEQGIQPATPEGDSAAHGDKGKPKGDAEPPKWEGGGRKGEGEL